MTRTHRLWNSLPARILRPFAIALVVVFGLTTIYLGRAVRSEGVRELRERGALLADTLAYNAELPLLARDANALASLLEGAGRDPDVLRAEVLDASGRRLASYVPPSHETASGGAGHGAEKASLALESPILTVVGPASAAETSAFALDRSSDEATTRIGSVRILVSMETTASRTRRLQASIAGAGVALLLLCAGIGLWLVKVTGARLQALVEATRRIASGDLSVRVQAGSEDEIGEVGEAFNRMAADLEVARAEVLAERADLERRVALRGSELERAQETLVHNEKMSAVGQLVAGVAHELNNPLTVVLGYAGVLLREKTLEAGVRRKIELLAGEAERSRSIVQNLLTFARKQKGERGMVDVNEVITRTVGLRAYQLKNENIRMQSDLDPGLPRTSGDFNQLQQVILNLVVNAEQAIQDAGKGSRIRLASRSATGWIEIAIEDDGPGIPPATRAKIFEPFFTTKPVGRGTGLGLSICYGIVVEHGGTIDVESEPGVGTCFKIRLPVSSVGTGDAETSAQPDDLAAPAAEAVHHRVLVIDDDPGVLRFMADAFEGLPVTIETALGGRAGLARLAPGRTYDLILSDMRMPDVDGRAIFRYLREQRPDLEPRLVFTSGDVANPESLAFFEASGRPVLEKPFSVEKLRETVLRLAGERRVLAGPAGRL